MRAYENIYVNGKWVPSNGEGSLEVTNSATEEVIATVPAGTAADVETAVAAARAAFPAWSALPKEERAAYLMKIHAGLEARTDEIAQTIAQEVGMPLGAQQGHPGRSAEGQLRHRRATAGHVRVRERSRQLAGRARADRRRRLHHAVELPAAPDRAEGRSGARRRQHRRAEAERGGADQRVHPRRDHRRGRPARRCVQPRHRRRSGRGRGDRRASRRRHGQLHRLDTRRQARRRGGQPDREEDQPRARRQERQRHPRRRRLQQGRCRRCRQVLPELGPDLHRADPHAGAARSPGRSRRHRRDSRNGIHARRPVPEGQPSRTARSRRRSAIVFAGTSRRASTRAPRWSPAAPPRRMVSIRATSCSRPCSRTSPAT